MTSCFDISSQGNTSSPCSLIRCFCTALGVLIGLSVHTLVGATGVEEASGITRLDDMLLIVGDKTPGAYFTYPLAKTQEPLITLDPALQTQIQLPEGAVALDLEGIAVLVDGRVVVLSERLRALVGIEGIIAEYGTPLTEFGNRGLEGVAVFPDDHGGSRVAVLWEGGYPDYDQVPEELRRIVGRTPLHPVIGSIRSAVEKRSCMCGRLQSTVLSCRCPCRILLILQTGSDFAPPTLSGIAGRARVRTNLGSLSS